MSSLLPISMVIKHQYGVIHLANDWIMATGTSWIPIRCINDRYNRQPSWPWLISYGIQSNLDQPVITLSCQSLWLQKCWFPCTQKKHIIILVSAANCTNMILVQFAADKMVASWCYGLHWYALCTVRYLLGVALWSQLIANRASCELARNAWAKNSWPPPMWWKHSMAIGGEWHVPIWKQVMHHSRMNQHVEIERRETLTSCFRKVDNMSI